MIIEVSTNRELYDIIMANSDLILCFYVKWRYQCTDFIKYLYSHDPDRTICLINIDILPRAQNVYNVIMNATPYVIFMKDTKIINYFYGNKQEVFDDLIN